MNQASHVMPAPAMGKLSRFRGVTAWIFDLDNTLYPSGNGIFPQVQGRIRDYVQRLLDTTPEEAERIQHEFYERYGATLHGLVKEYGIDTDAFLEYVHDVDHSMLAPNPRLARAIGRLPGCRYILTNGSRKHAERVAAALGFTEEFDDVFDIVWAGQYPKPSPEVYDLLLRHTGIQPASSAIFEDLARNLIVPHRMGMVTTLVVPPAAHGVIAGTAGRPSELRVGTEVDFVTEDLAMFVETVLRDIERPSQSPSPDSEGR